MKTKDLLLAYSEWLDGEGLVRSDDEGDERTHEELADAFVAQWQGVPFTHRVVERRTCDECGHDADRHWLPGGCHFGGSATSCRCNFGSAR